MHYLVLVAQIHIRSKWRQREISSAHQPDILIEDYSNTGPGLWTPPVFPYSSISSRLFQTLHDPARDVAGNFDAFDGCHACLALETMPRPRHLTPYSSSTLHLSSLSPTLGQQPLSLDIKTIISYTKACSFLQSERENLCRETIHLPKNS